MKQLFYALAFGLVACSAPNETNAPDPPAEMVIAWTRTIAVAPIEEPSGIVYHPQRGTLFVVDDDGDVVEMSADGTILAQKRVLTADFEGITAHPETGYLYIAVEGLEKIIEVFPNNLNVLREYDVDSTFQGSTVLHTGGEGLEGICFVPDTTQRYGGTFFVTNQSFSLNDTVDPSAVFELEIPLGNNTAQRTARILRYFSLGQVDLSGIFYDAAAGCLYVVSDQENLISAVDLAGNVLQRYRLQGEGQEGITIDPNGGLFVAQDVGDVLLIQWQR